jgi:hypothetical protein
MLIGLILFVCVCRKHRQVYKINPIKEKPSLHLSFDEQPPRVLIDPISSSMTAPGVILPKNARDTPDFDDSLSKVTDVDDSSTTTDTANTVADEEVMMKDKIVPEAEVVIKDTAKRHCSIYPDKIALFECGKCGSRAYSSREVCTHMSVRCVAATKEEQKTECKRERERERERERQRERERERV